MLDNPIVNLSRCEARRVEVDVGVAYDSDLDEVMEVAQAALCALPWRDEERPADVVFTGFGGSSIDLKARVWLPQAADVAMFAARSDVIRSIKAHFDAAGIEIPFPIRTLDLGDSTPTLQVAQAAK